MMEMKLNLCSAPPSEAIPSVWQACRLWEETNNVSAPQWPHEYDDAVKLHRVKINIMFAMVIIITAVCFVLLALEAKTRRERLTDDIKHIRIRSKIIQNAKREIDNAEAAEKFLREQLRQVTSSMRSLRRRNIEMGDVGAAKCRSTPIMSPDQFF